MRGTHAANAKKRKIGQGATQPHTQKIAAQNARTTNENAKDENNGSEPLFSYVFMGPFGAERGLQGLSSP